MKRSYDKRSVYGWNEDRGNPLGLNIGGNKGAERSHALAESWFCSFFKPSELGRQELSCPLFRQNWIGIRERQGEASTGVRSIIANCVHLQGEYSSRKGVFTE